MKKFLIIIFLFSLITMLNAKGTALVLSGGGSRALAQVGVLKLIDSLNVKIDYIVGTSTGAFIGALYSMGYSGKEIEKLLKNKDWKAIFNDFIRRKDYNIAEKRWMPLSKYYFFIDNIYKPQFPKGFMFGENFILQLFSLTYPTYKVKNFDTLPIKFRCVATNLLTGEEKIFNSGNLYESIRASMAFPAILQPFKIGKNIYIDGGITDNFPVDVAKSFNPDFIIGIKTNTDLKNMSEMASAIDILKQTVNINIIKKVKKGETECNLLIEPYLTTSFMDFVYNQNVVDTGEKEARKYIGILSKLPKRKNNRKKIIPQNEKIKIDKILVYGNRYLSKAKVLEYLNLKAGNKYSSNDLINAFKNAYNTDLFNYIYPDITQKNGKTILKVIEEEKLRKKVGFNYAILNDKFSANIYGVFTNLLQKNSKLILNLKIGNENEILEDYVKNFGKNWGAYFRIFSNLSEKKFIVYNDSTYFKMKSIKNKDNEVNIGSGIFITSAIAAELYGFLYNAKYSRDIGDYLGDEYKSWGMGFKIYHESLDNFVFPMSGIRVLSKYRIYKIQNIDKTQFSFQLKSKFIVNLEKSSSLIYSNEVGFLRYNSPSKIYNPFLIGGMNSFLGLDINEVTSAKYLINRLAIREKLKNFYIDFETDGLIFKNTKRFDIVSFGIKLGVETFFGPIKTAVAITDHGQKELYFSLGYDFDAFEFSRR